jgi:hypothetical protein
MGGRDIHPYLLLLLWLVLPVVLSLVHPVVLSLVVVQPVVLFWLVLSIVL